MKIHL